MKIFARRLVLLVLATLPIASISFAATKALKLGELHNGRTEAAGQPSRISGGM